MYTEIFHNVLVRILIALIVAAILQVVGHFFIERTVRQAVKRSKGETKLDEKKREDTVIAVARTTYTGILWLSTIFAILTLLGVNVAALLTGAGIIGVFVGLSAQNTVKDFLGGLFILLEKQYRVGDTVNFAGGTIGATGISGRVEEITLRITKLRDLSGNLITIRNGEPTVISNKTYSFASTVLDITVTYDSDILAVEKMINDIGTKLANDPEWQEQITKPIRVLRVDSFSEAGVVVRAVGTVQPASQWDVAGEFRKRMLVAASKEGDKVKLAHS